MHLWLIVKKGAKTRATVLVSIFSQPTSGVTLTKIAAHRQVTTVILAGHTTKQVFRIHAPSVPQVNIKMNSLQVHFVKLVLLENIMMLIQVLLFAKIVRQGHGTMRQVELNYHTAKIVWQENSEQLQVCQHV